MRVEGEGKGAEVGLCVYMGVDKPTMAHFYGLPDGCEERQREGRQERQGNRTNVFLHGEYGLARVLLRALAEHDESWSFCR